MIVIGRIITLIAVLLLVLIRNVQEMPRLFVLGTMLMVENVHLSLTLLVLRLTVRLAGINSMTHKSLQNEPVSYYRRGFHFLMRIT